MIICVDATFVLSSTSALTTLAESVGGIKATTRSAALLALDAFRVQNPAQRLHVWSPRFTNWPLEPGQPAPVLSFVA